MDFGRVGPGRRPAVVALALALSLVAAACGGDDGTGPPSPASLEGTWTGTTSQGRSLRFVISNGQLTSMTVGFRVQGSFCTSDGDVTVGGGVPIVETQNFSTDITFTDPAIHIEGSFRSSSSADGTVRFTSGQCNGTATATWTASKGSGGSQSGALLTGTWQGSYSTSLVPPVGATVTLIQNGSTFSGSFVGTNDYTGTISGTVSGSSVQFTLTNTVSGCPGSFTGTGTVNGSTLTATFQGSDCLGTHSNGAVNLTKQ